jgi:SAM-dependent methyltransferase
MTEPKKRPGSIIATDMSTTKKQQRDHKTDYYDDPDFDYTHFWEGREYEHDAEKLAISRLLEGKHFKHAVDIGGGYGRLSMILKQYADQVTLAEPSKQQLELAARFLRDHPEVHKRKLAADQLDFEDASIDLAIIIRVLHHVPDPAATFEELARILHKDGYAVVEIANYLHVRNRVRHFIRRQPLPSGPVDISTELSDGTPFVNHNPRTVRRQLAHAGLKVERILSVSNLRSGRLKRLMPKRAMLAIEGILQPTLAKGMFGPSIFFLVRKVK